VEGVFYGSHVWCRVRLLVEVGGRGCGGHGAKILNYFVRATIVHRGATFFFIQVLNDHEVDRTIFVV
jgi:hypothetical protein